MQTSRTLTAKRLPVPARQTGATPDACLSRDGRQADPPAPTCLRADTHRQRLRQAGGLTADEIKLVEEASQTKP